MNFKAYNSQTVAAMAKLFIDPDWEFLAAPMYVDFLSPEFRADFVPSGNRKPITAIEALQLQGMVCLSL